MKTICKTNNFRAVGIVAIATILVVILSISLVGCAPKQSQKPENDFSAEVNNTEHVKLAMGTLSTVVADNSVSRTLTATVFPASATNKVVDWSVEWGDSTNTSAVTDFVTVTPESSGSATATVTCKKAFTGTAVITVVTRESGYSATCVVSFLGIPTDIALSGSVTPSGNNLKLGVGRAYDFSIAPSNPFGSVGSQFNNISYTLSGVGSMILGYMEHYNSSGNDKWYDECNKTVTLDSMKNTFISSSYANGKLTITTIKSVESYYASYKRIDNGRTGGYTDKFRSYVDDCYFSLVIRESVSGLTKEYQIRFDSAIVTGITISGGEMRF